VPEDRPAREVEVDLADAFDPFKSPSRLLVAMANVALPVMIARQGGFVTWTDEEWQAIADQYGGTVAVQMERTKDGRWEARLRRGKPRKKERPT
jgi:hypothetical protein